MRSFNAEWCRILLAGVLASGAVAAIAGLIVSFIKPGEPEVPAEVWAKVQPHLDALNNQTTQARDRRLVSLRQFFHEREKGAQGFAEEALSWSGKWALIKQTLHMGAADAQRKQLSDAFGRHVFTGADLQAEMERAVRGHLSDLEGMENDMLVKIRADLNDSDLGRGKKPASMDSDATFKAECKKLEAELLPTLSRELGITAGREVVSFVAMDVATQVILRVTAGVAAELGVSAGILGTGAASTIETLGVGLVAGIVIDAMLSRIMKAFGHDPEQLIAQQTVDLVERMAGLMIDGDPEVQKKHDSLVLTADYSWIPSWRDAARVEAEGIEKSGRLGLRWELAEQDRLRAVVRTAAIRKLILDAAKP